MKKANYVRVNKPPMNKLLTTITILCFCHPNVEEHLHVTNPASLNLESAN